MRTFTTALSLLALAALNQTNAVELTTEASASGSDSCTLLSGIPKPADWVTTWWEDRTQTAEGDAIEQATFTSDNTGQNAVTDEAIAFTVGRLECSSGAQREDGRHMLAIITHTHEDETQMASYEFLRDSRSNWIEDVPLDSEFLTKRGPDGTPATLTFTMDSFDAEDVWAIAYENDDCSGVQQVIIRGQEFAGFNKGALEMNVSSSRDSTSTGGRGGYGGRLAQTSVSQLSSYSVTWTETYAKSFKLMAKAGVDAAGVSLKVTTGAGGYESEDAVELTTQTNTCVQNTAATQIYAEIQGL